MKTFIGFFVAAVLGIASGIVLCIVFQVEVCRDQSMEPAINYGDHVLINRLVLEGRYPRKGEVVALKNSIYLETGEDYICLKRVHGSSGDFVDASGQCRQRIPTGQVFVTGDNKDNSTDSRNDFFGMVHSEDIIGKVIWKW